MEGDQEDPLINSDEESGCGSEVESSRCSSPLPLDSSQPVITVKEKLHFLLTALLVAASTCVLVVTLPLYVEAVNVQSDVYCSLLFTGGIGTALLVALGLLYRLCSREMPSHSRIPFIRTFRVGALTGISGTVILYALDRKRVLCHLQDPILGICLAFSLAFYFIFCEKAMGLQRIFSATIIIVGVFISVDYQLCNEFRCHGNDRVAGPTSTPEHNSAWTWGTHLAWAIVCAIGLALWALSYALLENDLIKCKAQYTPSLLTTVSRLVEVRDMDSCSPLLHGSVSNSTPTSAIISSRKTKLMGKEVTQEQQHHGVLNAVSHSLSLATSILAAQFVTTILLAWTAMFRPLGKASSPSEWWHMLMSGLLCHVSPSSCTGCCTGVAVYGWIFALSYITMLVSSLHFLTLSESSIFTLACGSLALPIAGAWWSLFSSRDTILTWAPVLTGELVCSLLGLPVVLTGLGMLCRAHWIEIRLRKIASPCSPT